jgi:uracil-DNA glycosylase family 4
MLTARQQHCLRGIGIDVWSERGAASESKPETGLDVEILSTAEMDDIRRFTQRPEQAHDLPLADFPSPENHALPASTAVAVETPVPTRLDSWDSIINAIDACNACELAQNCTRKVPGVGNRHADLLIVGEGPGHDEDIRGEPFVGRSGQLLDRMLAAIGFAREQVYITNIVKCRPPDNRDPKQLEAQQCRAFLDAQIEQLAPRVILSVGRVSAHHLLASNLPVGKLIQQMHKLPGTEIPLKVTYHPAYLLRNPSAKAIVWQDLKLIYQMLQ